jgi:hypothetical protein
MRLSYICIIFFVFSKLGYSQVPSDTISYEGSIFRIVLPAKYNSKLIPKILRNKIVLVDKTENKVQCLIRNYKFGAMVNQKYAERNIDGAGLGWVISAFTNKNVSSFWVTDVNAIDECGVEAKPIIPGFKMERVK